MEVGELGPEDIHLPNIFVDRIIVGKNYEKRIEVREKGREGRKEERGSFVSDSQVFCIETYSSQER